MVSIRIKQNILALILLSVTLLACQSEKPSLTDAENTLNTLNLVSPNELYRTIQAMEKFETRYTWQKQEEVADYLFRRFQEYGIRVDFDEYDFKDKRWKNVIATLEGKHRPDDVYMVIAHLDSISDQPQTDAPGADDNASGTAAVLEIARILADIPLESTVKLALFSNEEQGRPGSKHFVKMAREQGWQIRAAINVDIVGYNDPVGALSPMTTENAGILSDVKYAAKRVKNLILRWIYPEGIVTIAGRPKNEVLVETLVAQGSKYSGLGIKKVVDNECGCGDEGSFWEQGYDAVYVNSYYRNPYRESVADKLEHLDASFLKEVTRLVLSGIIQLARPVMKDPTSKFIDNFSGNHQ